LIKLTEALDIDQSKENKLEKGGSKSKQQKQSKNIRETGISVAANGSLKSKRERKETNKLKEFKTGLTKTKKIITELDIKKTKKGMAKQDEVYVIESLIEKEGSMYLVKWDNYSHFWNTWEPRNEIPAFIVKYYEEDLGRLGTPAPSALGQIEDDSEAEDEFEVENILERRVTKKGKVEYLVKWKNVDELETTWESADNLQSVPNLINKFEKELKTHVDSFHFTDDSGIRYSISAAARQEAEQVAEQAAENATNSDNDELFVDINTVKEVVLGVSAATSETQVAEVMIKPGDFESFWEGSNEYVKNVVDYRLKVIGIDVEEIKIIRDNSDSITSCFVKMQATQLKKIEKDTFPFKNWMIDVDD